MCLHHKALPTQGDTYESRKNLVLNCAGGPRVQRLESCSHEICRGKKMRLAFCYERHTFQTASERAVLKCSSGTCWYHQLSLFNISHTKEKKVIKFLKFTTDTQLHAFPFGPVTGHHKGEIRAFSSSSPHKEATMRSPLSFLHAEQTK